MITCVSLNPSIDRTLEVDAFTQGGLNRVRAQKDVAAGKGANVALAAAALGARAECIGFMYREGGALFEARLEAGGVARDFLWCEGAVRVNLKVFDRARSEITELNASGAPVDAARLEAMAEMARAHARGADFLVLSGSTPPGCPADFYRSLAEIAAQEGCRAMLDADGDRLRLGLSARPFLIKPNRYELELLSGRELRTREAVLQAALECVRAGARLAAVSLGAEGALITDGREALYAPALRVELKSTVAAGDSMLAGLAAGFLRGGDMADAFRLGVAAATARCAAPPEEIIAEPACRAFAAKVELERMALA